MKTDLKSVIHLYLGQAVRVLLEDENGKFTIETKGRLSWDWEEDSEWILFEDYEEEWDFRWKLLLRPLDSITEEEAIDIVYMTSYVYLEVSAEVINSYLIRFEFEYKSSRRRRSRTLRFDELNSRQFAYLLSKGFDLFALIPNGEALNINEYGK